MAGTTGESNDHALTVVLHHQTVWNQQAGYDSRLAGCGREGGESRRQTRRRFNNVWLRCLGNLPFHVSQLLWFNLLNVRHESVGVRWAQI